jgi:hypothetical protein
MPSGAGTRKNMVTFLVVVGPATLANPDTDLRELIPDLIENHSAGLVQSDGWGYAPDDAMHLFFRAPSSELGEQHIRTAIESTPVLGNDLSMATIAIRSTSEGPFTTVHPPANRGQSIPDIDV